MDYIRAFIHYGILAAILVAIIIGIQMAPRFGNSTVAPPDYRDLAEIPRYSTVAFDGTVTLQQYRVGDLVVISLGDDVTGDTYFGWVGGIPGSQVEVRNSQLWVDGRALEDVVSQNRQRQGHIAPLRNGLVNVAPITVPAHHLYVVSDGHEFDSVQRGLFPSASVRGRVSRIRTMD